MCSKVPSASVVLIFVTLAIWAKAGVAAEKPEEKAPPKVGEESEDFTLHSIGGDEVALSESLEEGPVVLLVLRGYPGYQCPLCSRQVADFLGQAKKFADQGAQVLMVYPGPADELDERAKEFLKNAKLPKHFQVLLDPDYEFTELYNLRWDEPNETAYPSTFVIEENGNVAFAKVSKSHGDRTTAKEVLAAMNE